MSEPTLDHSLDLESNKAPVYTTKRTDLFYCREFLNLPNKGSSAHIIGKIGLEKEFKDNKLHRVYSNNTLQISDCNNKINLEISTNKEYAENSIYKLDKLIEVLTQMRAALKKIIKEREKLDKQLVKSNYEFSK